MNNIYEIITVDDVQEFLKSIGYEWNKKCYEGKRLKVAEEFWEVSNSFFKELVFDDNIPQNSKEKYLWSIKDICFIRHSYVDKKLGESKDYTNEWKKFLIKKYGKQYVNCVLENWSKETDEVISECLEEISALEKLIKAKKKCIIDAKKSRNKLIADFVKLEAEVNEKIF